MKKSIYFLLLLFFSFPIRGMSQTAVEIVNQFGDWLSEYLSTDDQRVREKIYSIAPDGGNAERLRCMHCLVDNGISNILSKDETDGFDGDCQIETYLNKLTLEKHKLKFTHGIPILLKDYKEPVAFTDKKTPMRLFVKMDVTIKGDINYSGTDVFFIDGDRISMIVDAGNPLSKGVELYSSKRYEEAFRLFRELAYKAPNNFEAQYYTAVMEIKKQGCGFLGAKVRDMEAAWWIIRGGSWRLSELESKFMVDKKKLPFSELNNDIYLSLLREMKLVSESRIPFRSKNGLYGYMNEEGKEIKQPQYNLAFSFDPCGLAPVVKDSKVGFVDKGDSVVIPIQYDDAMLQWKDNKTFVLKDSQLLIIDKNGIVLNQLGIGYDKIGLRFFGDKVYVHNANSDKWYVYNINGDIDSVENTLYYIDLHKMCYFTMNKKGERLREEPFGW